MSKNQATEQVIKETLEQGIIEAIGDAISIQNPDFKILYQNQAHKDIIGDHVGEHCYQAYEQRDSVCEGCPLAMTFQDGGIYTKERSAPTDRGTIYVEITSSPLRDKTGKIIAGIEVVRDITERKTVEFYIERNAEILEMIATGQPPSIIYDAIALMYEARHPGMRCSLLELKGNKLMHGGAPSLPKEYCDAVNGLEYGVSVGSCGTSTYTGKRVLVEDIATDPKWTALKDVALPHGLRSCWSEPIRNPAGKVLGAFGMYYNHTALPNEEELRDLESAARLAGIIMERKRTEVKLHKSEKQLSTFINNITDMAWFKDTDSNFVIVNKAFGEAVGMDPEYLVNNSCEICFGTEAANKFKEDDQKVMKSRERVIFEESILDTKGNNILLETIKAPLFDESGKILGTIGVARDITERKKQADELNKSHSLINVIIEGTNDAFFVKDIEGRYIMINSFGSKVLGKQKEEILGKNDIEILPYKVANAIMKDDLYIIETGELKTYEETLLFGENSHIFLTTKRPYRDHQGNIIGLVGIARDITELKKSEKALMESENKLRMKATELEESNTALKVLIKQRENDKNESEGNILANVKHLIMPYIEKLKKNRAVSEDFVYLNILESNLKEIISPFAQKLSSNNSGLTPKEIQVANLTRDGKQDKEISEILNISIDTVKFHRKNIRKKLGLYGQRTNLRTYLLSEFK
jgi:PAS domain S-box-containing protein